MALPASHSAPPGSQQPWVSQVEEFSAHNYHPLPVVVAKAEGIWVEDVAGKRYMDMLAAYSAINFGHRHPALIAAAKEQLDRVTLTSRAFHNDQLGPFCEGLAHLCGMQMVLPMNTGAEAVETAIKTARKWGYTRKGVKEGQAKIIVCQDNFHGRTTTIISFSTDPQARAGFGPYTPGFEVVPYGDIAALERAIDGNTVGFLVEPIQGEAGVDRATARLLKSARALCATSTKCCSSPTKSNPAWGVPAKPLHANTNRSRRIFIFWVRPSGVASWRCPPSFPAARF